MLFVEQMALKSEEEKLAFFAAFNKNIEALPQVRLYTASPVHFLEGCCVCSCSDSTAALHTTTQLHDDTTTR